MHANALKFQNWDSQDDVVLTISSNTAGSWMTKHCSTSTRTEIYWQCKPTVSMLVLEGFNILHFKTKR